MTIITNKLTFMPTLLIHFANGAFYSNSQKVESASEPVGGTFSVQLDSSRVLDLLPSNISAAGFQLFLEHYFPEEGGN